MWRPSLRASLFFLRLAVSGDNGPIELPTIRRMSTSSGTAVAGAGDSGCEAARAATATEGSPRRCSGNLSNSMGMGSGGAGWAGGRWRIGSTRGPWRRSVTALAIQSRRADAGVSAAKMGRRGMAGYYRERSVRTSGLSNYLVDLQYEKSQARPILMAGFELFSKLRVLQIPHFATKPSA